MDDEWFIFNSVTYAEPFHDLFIHDGLQIHKLNLKTFQLKKIEENSENFESLSLVEMKSGKLVAINHNGESTIWDLGENLMVKKLRLYFLDHLRSINWFNPNDFTFLVIDRNSFQWIKRDRQEIIWTRDRFFQRFFS